MKQEQIKRVFTGLDVLKIKDGIWFSGIEKEGEYKNWWPNNKLHISCNYKQGNKKGEYKKWHENGQLWVHCFYRGVGDYEANRYEGKYKVWWHNGELNESCFYDKQGKLHGELKIWNFSGKLIKHEKWIHGDLIKDYLK